MSEIRHEKGKNALTGCHAQTDFSGARSFGIPAHHTSTETAVVSPERVAGKILLAERTLGYTRILFPRYDGLLQ